MQFTLATWNALADCYIHGQVGALDQRGEWKSRSELMRSTLTEAKDHIDVFCMQEVDHFDDLYSDLFKSFGFSTVYMQRPTKNDGCLIAFRSDKFELKHSQMIDLDQLSHLDRQLQRTGRSKFAKQNVSVLAVLECRETQQRFLAATCHLHWNPNLPEVKFAQAYYIMDRISAFRVCHQDLPVVFTGDFNSLPSDEVYRFITSDPSSRATTFQTIEEALSSQIESTAYTYGPKTKFLCDSSLSRLARWLRILGVDVAQDSWDLKADNTPTPFPASMSAFSSPRLPNASAKSVKDHDKKLSITAFFHRARHERRVILTTSKSLLQRSSCPPSYFVKPGKLEEALVDMYREFGLELKKERFLTVCGKCGGEIEDVRPDDPRVEGKMLPTDRQVFVCVQCGQPYWWSDHENSSPAKALRQADALFELIVEGLRHPLTPAADAPAGLPPRPEIGVLAPPSAPARTAAVAHSGHPSALVMPTSECPCEQGGQPAPPCGDEESFINHIKAWGERSPAGDELFDNELDGYASDGHFVRVQSAAPSRDPSRARPAPPDRHSGEDLVAPMARARLGEPEESLGMRFAARNALLSSSTSEKRADPGLAHRTPAPLALPHVRVDVPEADAATPANGRRTPVADERAAGLVEMRSAFGTAETEPALTNWNGEFTGTLDYVFVTKDWVVKSARVAPTALVGADAAQTPEGRGIFSKVKSSQPSEQWPSDHFMIITQLSFSSQSH